MIAAVALPERAEAREPSAPNYPGFAFGAPAGEALLAIGAALSNAAIQIPQQRTGWGPDAPHPFDPAADRVSDFTGAFGGSGIALAAGYGLEAAYFGDAGVRGGGVYALRGPLVDLEAALLSTGVVQGLKRLTARCRPRYFVDGTCTNEERDAFPSGHTSPISGIAGARLVLAAQTQGSAGFRWGSFGLAEVMAITTAALRVKAGMHSWTDVGAGFLLGHAIGALVALAHPVQVVDVRDWTKGPDYERAAQGSFALTWSGVF